MTQESKTLAKLQRLPRPVYWILGATIAFTGATTANRLSAGLPLTEQLPYWLAGSAVIFLGLWILSLGTRARTGRPPS